MEQSVKLTTNMRATKNVFAAFTSMLETNMDQEKWSKAYPGYWKIVGKVQRLRMEQKKSGNRS
jgi:hypothetical protein